MNAYAVIETGGEQIRVEPGRFYDVRHSASLRPNLSSPNTKILIYRVLMIYHESTINLGHPWLGGAVVKGRILQSRLENRITIHKKRSGKKTRRKLGHQQDLVRFVVDSICPNGKDLYE
uniref:Large ribosomal subunit protein bL21c n=1 Tax=Isoetes nuttallii TaxID=358751 RepID=A0A2U8KJC8_9TRAC|nr:ribosomal protein L21 [Isoetes nuttallii]AWK92225.1 ribosomal protein L21 [Isoetes nuttallii]